MSCQYRDTLPQTGISSAEEDADMEQTTYNQNTSAQYVLVVNHSTLCLKKCSHL